MKRDYAAFLLALALLLAQLGGASHALSHYGHAEDKERPHSVCQLCIAYAALDQGRAAFVNLPLPAGDNIVPATVVLHGCRSLVAVVYRSRAPPFLAV